MPGGDHKKGGGGRLVQRSNGPILSVPAAEFVHLARRMALSTATYGGARAEGTENFINGIVQYVQDHPEGLHFYVYMYQGIPVGLMVLDTQQSAEDQAAHVLFLVAHEGASQGGSAMIEHAVLISRESGYEGRLTLDSKLDAVGFYQGLGFQKKNNHHGLMAMTLDPNQSPRWAGNGELIAIAKGGGQAVKAGSPK